MNLVSEGHSSDHRQPQMSLPHQKSMRPRRLLSCLCIAFVFLLSAITACNNSNNPDEIRQRTAEATETMRRDTKAVVEGVKEGMGRGNTVNINKASREELLGLPGLTDHEADRIVAERPFGSADDLVKRRIIPQSEYDKIRDRIIAGH
jgi:DNA uptake protein ComE-like DNA-binding protein